MFFLIVAPCRLMLREHDSIVVDYFGKAHAIILIFCTDNTVC